MEKHLDLYRDLKISKSELQQALGEDLHNVECKKAYLIKGNDVANAIRMLQNGEIAVVRHFFHRFCDKFLNFNKGVQSIIARGKSKFITKTSQPA